MDKNQEGMCDEEENVDTGEENTEDEEVFEVAIEGDGDCFYSSIVEAFRREGVSLCSLELKSSTKSLVTGVKCLRLCVASALTPETFEVLQQHQQAGLEDFNYMEAVTSVAELREQIKLSGAEVLSNYFHNLLNTDIFWWA